MAKSIRYMLEKLKSFLRNDTYFIAILILLIGVSSFGLGRYSVMDSESGRGQAVSLQQLSPVETIQIPSSGEKVSVVVSKSGTKYHLFDCPGALQMKSENRIEFDDIEDAKAAGYSPAANCPGLN